MHEQIFHFQSIIITILVIKNQLLNRENKIQARMFLDLNMINLILHYLILLLSKLENFMER